MNEISLIKFKKFDCFSLNLLFNLEIYVLNSQLNRLKIFGFIAIPINFINNLSCLIYLFYYNLFINESCLITQLEPSSRLSWPSRSFRMSYPAASIPLGLGIPILRPSLLQLKLILEPISMEAIPEHNLSHSPNNLLSLHNSLTE